MNFNIRQLNHLIENLKKLEELELRFNEIDALKDKISDIEEKIEQYKGELSDNDYSLISNKPSQSDLRCGDEDYSYGSNDEEEERDLSRKAENREEEVENIIEEFQVELSDCLLKRDEAEERIQELMEELNVFEDNLEEFAQSLRDEIIELLIELFTGEPKIDSNIKLPLFDATRGIAFEHLIRLRYQKQGLDVQITKQSRDNGVDLYIPSQGIIVQCKQGSSYDNKKASITREIIGTRVVNDGKIAHLWLSHGKNISKSKVQEYMEKLGNSLRVFGMDHVIDFIRQLENNDILVLLNATLNIYTNLTRESSIAPLPSSFLDYDPYLENYDDYDSGEDFHDSNNIIIINNNNNIVDNNIIINDNNIVDNNIIINDNNIVDNNIIINDNKEKKIINPTTTTDNNIVITNNNNKKEKKKKKTINDNNINKKK